MKYHFTDTKGSILQVTDFKVVPKEKALKVIIDKIRLSDLQRRKSKRGGRGDMEEPSFIFFSFFYLSGRYEYSCADSGIPSSTCRQDKTTRENTPSCLNETGLNKITCVRENNRTRIEL